MPSDCSFKRGGRKEDQPGEPLVALIICKRPFKARSIKFFMPHFIVLEIAMSRQQPRLKALLAAELQSLSSYSKLPAFCRSSSETQLGCVPKFKIGYRLRYSRGSGGVLSKTRFDHVLGDYA